jgi:hypothetical protein
MKDFRIKNYEIYSEKVARETVFAFLTDLHGLNFGPDNRDLLDALEQIAPDAVLCAGDMNVNRETESLQKAQSFLLAAAGKFPVYYALGNHEYKMYRSEEFRESYLEYERTLKKGGVCMLRNEKTSVRLGGTLFWITGLELPIEYYHKPRSPKLTLETLEGLVDRPGEDGFQILLAHNPKYGETYFSWGADLTLCGHYHGGVLRFGENRGLTCPQYLLFPPFCCGAFQRGSRHMIVSAGLGEHTIPVRIHNPRELLAVKVKPIEKNSHTM